MFSTGKPIVNIVNNMEDCALSYFRKYKNVLSINAKNIDIMESNPLHLIGVEVNADKLFNDYTPYIISKNLLNDD